MRIIQFLSVSLLILGTTWSCGFKSENPGALKSDYPGFDSFFQNIEHFSGNVLVAQHGKIIYSKNMEYADRELLVENSMKTKFRIGSISKPITALAVMLLEEKGLIKVEKKLSEYLSDLPASWQDITIHQLLTHTSGLDFEADFEKEVNIWCAPSNIKEIFEHFKSMPLVDVPGNNFHYSNIGYFTLTVLVEEVTRETFEDFIHEEILHKLKMQNSGGDNPLKILEHRAKGYTIDNEGTIMNAPFDNMITKRGAGNMFSTVEDLINLKLVISPNFLLSSESIEKMIMPYALDSEMGSEVYYGYGFDVIQSEKGSAIFHTGGVSGFESVFHFFPEKDIVIAGCANIRPNNSDWRSKFPELVYQTL